MIKSIEDLGISDPGYPKMGRLPVNRRQEYVGTKVEYDHREYYLVACSRKYAYLSHENLDINKSEAAEKTKTCSKVFSVPRGHVWVKRLFRHPKSRSDLIEKIKASRNLDWTVKHDDGQSVVIGKERSRTVVKIEI